MQSEIGSVHAQMRDLKTRLEDYKRRIELTPQVESEYKALLMERGNTQAKYDDLMRKFMESKVSQGLEKEQKGERFTIIDPARLPEKPSKPNRLAIMLIGLVLGLGGGIGSVAVKEYTDTSVRNAELLTLITSFPVLVSIPNILSDKDLARAKGWRKWGIIAALTVLILGIIIFHFTVMNLDVFWLKLIQRIGI